MIHQLTSKLTEASESIDSALFHLVLVVDGLQAPFEVLDLLNEVTRVQDRVVEARDLLAEIRGA